eukprot:gb/GECG01014765.1/.p1 GENE.gb/GECG01014765.1/~~gb/GECG01014765.1/.p1  ORF type:complete len:117 (+),score=2.19 gb/GECG01014765.1/:1-351(+)
MQAKQAVSIRPHSVRLTHQSSEDGVSLDFDTIQQLCLLETTNDNVSVNSLVSSLSKTYTDAGTRLLRAQIISPCADLATLKARADVRHWIPMRFRSAGHIILINMRTGRRVALGFQ